MANAFGSHYDVYTFTDGQRMHVGMVFEHEPLLGEDPTAFQWRVERQANEFRKSGLENKVRTRFLSGDRETGIIELELEPRPAPLPKAPRGRRGGRKHAA